jgi:hypothetical protein
MQKDYIMLSDEEIPECCGSCKHLVINQIKCYLDKEKVCIFGYCNKYKPNKFIFGI